MFNPTRFFNPFIFYVINFTLFILRSSTINRPENIIFVVGCGHSKTSMVAKFLFDNGASMTQCLTTAQKYEVYEGEEFDNFVQNRRNFRKYKITKYLSDLPEDKVVVIKAPWAPFFLHEIQINRPIKVVYVLRNMFEVVESTMEKSNSITPSRIMNNYWSTYNAVMRLECPVFTIHADRLSSRNAFAVNRLLHFCTLSPGAIDFDGIRAWRKRNTSYLNYRIKNLALKIGVN